MVTMIAAHANGVVRFELPLRGESLAAWLYFISSFAVSVCPACFKRLAGMRAGHRGSEFRGHVRNLGRGNNACRAPAVPDRWPIRRAKRTVPGTGTEWRPAS
jgi:hypothetical protein